MDQPLIFKKEKEKMEYYKLTQSKHILELVTSFVAELNARMQRQNNRSNSINCSIVNCVVTPLGMKLLENTMASDVSKVTEQGFVINY